MIASDSVDEFLESLSGGAFDEPVALLRRAVREGAAVHLPRSSISSGELRNTYQVRRRHLQAINRHMPGFDLVTDLFSGDPEARWLLVGIEGVSGAGVIILAAANTKAVACFAYETDEVRRTADLNFSPPPRLPVPSDF